jgi:hypothetical protein
MPPQLTEEQRIRYRDLFEKLDSNADGEIDVNDLVVHFERNGLTSCQDNHVARAKVILHAKIVPIFAIFYLFGKLEIYPER